jgi:hypothetical protein
MIGDAVRWHPDVAADIVRRARKAFDLSAYLVRS